MNKLEEIKGRLNQYTAAQGYANQRTPMLVQLRREYLINFEQKSPKDIEYLLNEVERYKKTLNEIYNHEFSNGSHEEDWQDMLRIAEEALKES